MWRMTNKVVFALALSAIGLIVLYIRNKRIFSRGNQCGSSRYPSYLEKIISEFGDSLLFGLAMVFTFLGLVLMMNQSAYSLIVLDVLTLGIILVTGMKKQ
jgi:hypothetical protein